MGPHQSQFSGGAKRRSTCFGTDDQPVTPYGAGRRRIRTSLLRCGPVAGLLFAAWVESGMDRTLRVLEPS